MSKSQPLRAEIDELPAVVRALKAAFNSTTCLTGDNIPKRNLADWSGVAPQVPLSFLRPDTVEGVATAMRICAEQGVPVVPQGGMTGLCGGAVRAWLRGACRSSV